MPPLAAVAVRDATLDDAAEIALVHVRSWQAAYRQMIPDAVLDALSGQLRERTVSWQARIVSSEPEDRSVIVAELDGEIAGFASTGPCRDEDRDASVTGEIYGFYVDPPLWRQGVGSVLMPVATARLEDQGWVEASLWVLEENRRARTFYERYGFVADGTRKSFEIGGASPVEVRYERPFTARGRAADQAEDRAEAS